MKVVLDTNVIVAAFAGRGLCHDVFELCLKETNIVLSEFILKEVRLNLSKKLKLPQAKIETILKFLTDQSEVITVADLKSGICRDPDDINILATAKSGNVHAVVTGDEDLLVLKTFENILILSPREFWKLISRNNK